MPVYEYLCEACGAKTPDYVISWRDRRESVDCGSCGEAGASYVPSTFAPDFSTAGYKKLLREEGRIPFEPGLSEEIARNKKDKEARVQREVDKAVEASVQDAFTVNVSTG